MNENKVLVAKSYQNLPLLCEPYTVNGKEYVKVRLNNGTIKQVRSYSPSEYRKYNPEVKIIQKAKSQRDVFGFGEAGYIWLFKGDTYAALDWFRWAPTRYSEIFGWYLPSDIEMPQPLPSGITPVKLMWDKVCDEDGERFLPEAEVTAYVETLVFDPSPSEWLGAIKERLTLKVTCTRLVHFMNMYGESTMFIFEAENKDIVTWTTQTNQDIEEKHSYILVGTVKEHTVYKNTKQTVLSRCKIIKEIEIPE